MDRKQILKIIAIILIVLISLNVVRTVYIEILSYKSSAETIGSVADYFTEVKEITDKYGYSMSVAEPFDGAGTFEKAFKYKSDNFEFSVSVANWHDTVEAFYVYFDDSDYIDYEIILKVFNSISARNISKASIEKCHKSVHRGKDYEKNLIWFSDKCSIYGSSENKTICITGVPGLGI